MKSFRQRRKAKEADGDGSNEGQARQVPYLSGRTFRRNKKQVESKPEVDLTNALPSTDQFRTSLLMPNLSARFSMLRAQDDPFALIGKASDDSVLHKRVSRFGDLSDIAEAGSLRPPFANGRAASTASGDGYATDDDSMYGGSVMSRARPGESNNLFGGRQKVYKIPAGPTGSTKDLSGGGARFLYEHDVHKSAFQVFRERQRRESDEADRADEKRESRVEDSPRSRTRSDSPSPQDQDRRRETLSSTGSGPSNGRGSTAATSIASQGASSAAAAAPTPASGRAARAPSKSRRLYEQGLDQHMHEQQSSALSRLDQLARQRLAGAASPPPGVPLSHTNSASSLHDAGDRPALSLSTSGAIRPLSPSPPPVPTPSSTDDLLKGRELGSGEPKTTAPNPFPAHLQSPPISPVGSEDDDALSLPGIIRARDRGKATASGAFPRPQRPYDDDQYSQRQRQMQRGRMTPSSRRASPPGTSASPSVEFRRRKLEQEGWSRSGSETSLAGPASAGPAGPSLDAHAHAALTESTPGTPGLVKQGTFLAPLSDVSSDADSETEGERLLGVQPRHAPSAVEPVAAPAESALHSSVAAREPPNQAAPQFLNATSGSELPLDNAMDPPDLKGLVRQHLRSESNQSAMPAPLSPLNVRYPPDHAAEPGSAPVGDLDGLPSVTPLDLERISTGRPGNLIRFDTDSPTDSRLRESSPSPLRPSPLQTVHSPTELAEDSAKPSAASSVVNSVAAQHNRNPSLETRERQEFANELAERRKRVQENLKSFAESVASTSDSAPSSSSSSKAEQKRLSPLRTTSALGMRMPKSTPSSTQPSPTPLKLDTSSKAMKMLGITSTEVAQPPAREAATISDAPKSGVPDASDGPATVSPPRPARNWGQIRRDARKEFERRQRENKEAERHAGKTKTPSPPSSSGSGRNRSGSELSNGRSRLTNGLFKLDSQQGPTRGNTTPGAGPDATRAATSQPRSQRLPPLEPLRALTPRDGPGRGVLEPGRIPNAGMGPGKSPLPSPAEIGLPANFTPRASPGVSPSHASPMFSGDFPAPSATDSTVRDYTPSAGTLPAHRKKFVQKSAISEPRLVSCTSDISAVDLAEAAKSGPGRSELAMPPPPPPPVPPINPRRRTRFPGAKPTALEHGLDRAESAPILATTSAEGKSASPVDEPSSQKPRLWKSSSETTTAGNRMQAPAMTSPTGAAFAHERAPPAPLVPPVNGAMF